MKFPWKRTERQKLEQELSAYQEQADLNQLKIQVAAQRSRSTLPGLPGPQPVQESVLGLLNNGLGIAPVSSLLDPYRELLAIPGMIRERMVYKSAVVRTIQQQDFIRFVSKSLYEECTHFRTAIRIIQAMIFGRDGLAIEIVAKKGKKVSDEQLAKLNDIVKEFCKANKLPVMTKEGHRRYEIHGEVFIRIIEDKRDIPANRRKPTRVVFVEPDFIRPSEKHAANFEDPAVAGGLPSTRGTDWSFGIKNKSLDYTAPEAYQIVWPDTSEEQVNVDRMVHIKQVAFQNIKRGVSSAFAISDELIGATVLRAALREGAKVRAAIAGVCQHEQASKDDLTQVFGPTGQLAVQNGVTQTQRIDQNGNSYTLNAVNTEIGGILHIGKTSQWVDAPALPDGPAMQMVYSQTINTIAAHYQIPPNALSGESASAAYASALVEENSYTRAREEDQGVHCQLWHDVMDIILPIELERNGIDQAIIEEIDVQVSGPSLVVRNKLEEAKTDTERLAQKVKSRETIQIEQGLDPKEEDEKIETDEMAPEEETEEGKDTPETTGGQRQRDENAV
jgi:hypothetical protein